MCLSGYLGLSLEGGIGLHVRGISGSILRIAFYRDRDNASFQSMYHAAPDFRLVALYQITLYVLTQTEIHVIYTP
jgi:hypothetical protein